MAKPKKLPPPSTPDTEAALAQADTPIVKWGVVAQIAAATVVVWALAIGAIPYAGYWLVGGAAIGTLVLAGFGVYAWRIARRQRRLLSVLRRAGDEEGRKAAIAELEAQGTKDGMAALARAQLILRDDPKQALQALEAIDLAKEPGQVQDEVRANLALLYLMQGRPRDARPVTDQLRLDRQPNAKAKAMYAAVMAEASARTGSADEARRLLETYPPDDPSYGEVAMLLLRAQIYTYHATKNRGLVRKAMRELAARDPNQLAPFVKGPADLQQAVREVLGEAGFQTRAKTKIQRQ